MTDRAALASEFCARAGWALAERRVLAGDASNRRYDRLTDPTLGRAVLMDAPPEKGEDVRPFLSIARILSDQGLSAPQILAEDKEQGFLLLEDLGDDLYARVVLENPEIEEQLYTAAVDVLVALHHFKPPVDLPTYDAATMAPLADLALEWYAPNAEKTALSVVLEPLLTAHAPRTEVLVLRDYHAENLLWLPDRIGIARVGQLDFQDAMRGHPAYDLVSLLKDARRDVPEALQTRLMDHYTSATGQEPEGFRSAAAIQSAQRNLRILGVFARLCLRDGKAHYVDLIPRVWRNLQSDLSDPALVPVARVVADLLPTPTPDILQDLKARCATAPQP